MSITKISPSVVDFDAGITISTTDNSDNLTLTSTDADANVGPAINLYRNSGTPADNDFLGNIKFNGRNDNTQDVQYAEVEAYILDASDGTEDGLYNINVMTAGTNTSYMQLKAGSGVVFNEDSNDIDFRVESNGDTHRLFIDGGNDRILIGTTASRTMSGVTSDFFIEGTTYDDSSIGMAINANGANDCPAMFFGKSRGTSLGSNTIVQNGDRLFSMRIDGSDGTNLEQAAVIEVHVDAAPGANEIPGRITFLTTTDGSQYATEKMRITNDGRVGIGTASPSNYSGQFVVYEDQSGAFNSYFLNDNSGGYGLGIQSDSGNQIFFYIGGTHQGTISSSGGTTAYGTSSDYRLKENVVDLSNGITRLKALKPKQFNFIADETNTLRDGFLAHEAQEVVPEAVAGEKDAEINDKGIGYQQMDYGKITPLLTAALQEAIAKIETLEAKVKALEEA